VATKAFYSEVTLKKFIINVLGLSEYDDFSINSWNQKSFDLVNAALKGKVREF
jgi:hypothetical protein